MVCLFRSINLPILIEMLKHGVLCSDCLDCRFEFFAQTNHSLSLGGEYPHFKVAFKNSIFEHMYACDGMVMV